MMPEFTTSWRHAEETFTAETDTKLVWDGASHSSSDVVWMNGSLLGMLGMQETLTRPEVSRGWSTGSQSPPGNKPSN